MSAASFMRTFSNVNLIKNCLRSTTRSSEKEVQLGRLGTALTNHRLYIMGKHPTGFCDLCQVKENIEHIQERKPRGDWGDGPPKVWGGGTAHAFVPPNILRSSVVGCVWKELKKVFSCEERVMYEGSYTTFNKVKLLKISKNSKNLVDD